MYFRTKQYIIPIYNDKGEVIGTKKVWDLPNTKPYKPNACGCIK